MFTGLCHLGSWGSYGSFGAWGGIGLIVSLLFGIGLLVGLVVMAVWAIRRTPGQAAAVPFAAGQLTAKEIL